MFLVNEILVFTPGRRQEGLDRLGWIHGLMAPQPGFIGAIVAKYQGDPTKHTVLRFWENIEAYQRFREGPDGNYGRGRPEGLYSNEQVVPQWESVLEGKGDAKGSFLVKVQMEVPEGAWDGFTEHRKRVQAAALSFGGVEYFRQFRAKDRSEALLVGRWRSRDDAERWSESAEFGAVRGGAPEGVQPISAQYFEVASDVGPK